MLARAGIPVTLIGRHQHMHAIAQDGLMLDGLRVHQRIHVGASTSLDSVRGAQLVMFCVKTVDNESVACEMQQFLDPDAAVLSFQNGVDNVDRIHAATAIRAIPVAVYVAAAMTASGCVTHTGRGDIVIGNRSGWPQEHELQSIAELFERAEIPCRISDAIEVELWTKLVMNCAYNAISALTCARYGRIVQFEPVSQIMQRAVLETIAVARAEGVLLPETAVLEAALQLGDAMSGALSSTAQDIARGKVTEIDSLNGYVSRRGSVAGVRTPVNDTLYALVKLREQDVVR
jgi:2-dehydropantoate 2-reductase